MDLESSSESEKNTSLTLQTANDCSAHSTQDPSEKTSSECKENVKDSDGSKSETCHSESSENLSKCENSLINNDSVINGKHDEKDEPSNSKETTLKNESSEVEPVNATKSSLSDKIECSEESLSSDGQNEQISNGLSNSSDLNDGKSKCHSEVSELASQDVKTKDNIKETVCTTTKSESSLSHSRSFSVITRSKQSAKKGMSNASSRDKTEKSFVLSEVTDDDIEQIKDDSCFPDYLANLLSVGRYIPVKIVNPSDYRPKNNETLIEAPSLTVPLLVKERNIYFDKTYKPERRKNTANSTQDNYFSSSVGQFLIGLGFSRVREWYHRDMAKVKERQIRRSGKSAELEGELQEHRNEHLQAKQANEPFTCPMKKCQMCPFQTESHLILEGHYLTPHVSSRREYLCNFCNFNSRDPKLILFHMEAIHSKHGIINLPVFYECPFCSFESHLKTKFSSHITRCQRTFRCAFNQSAPRDFPYPTLTPKPVTTSDIKEYENSFANLGNSMPYSTKSQKYLMSHSSGSNRPVISNMPTLYQQLASVEYQQLHHLSANNVQLLSGSGVIRTKYPVMNQVHCGQNKVPFPITSNHIYHFVNSNGQLVPVMGKDLVNPTSRLSFLQNSAESNSQPRKSSHGSSHDNGSVARIIKSDGKKNIVTLQPSESKTSSISHAPRAHATQSAQSPKSTLPKVATTGQSSKIVICEICDGYIKDLEQLQTHMHWIHKVKIHPKMLASRPPLNCQKCQSRFFTDQGLERHLLGTHGLVTPNMQDMANKNQDGGCCTICRQFYACKLVAHISQVHKITLKPAHLSYKCTVCSATFSLYRQFENHVYSVHSGSGKRSADSDSTQSSKKAALSLAGKKINSSLVDKQGKILEKNTSLSSNKGELGDLASNHAGTNSLNYFKDKQGKHSLQPLTRLKRRKFLRSSDGQ